MSQEVVEVEKMCLILVQASGLFNIIISNYFTLDPNTDT